MLGSYSWLHKSIAVNPLIFRTHNGAHESAGQYKLVVETYMSAPFNLLGIYMCVYTEKYGGSYIETWK
jgi:hypothetical protein